MSVIGLDIGGANLKLATCDGHFAARSFPLWQRSQELGEAISELLACVSSGDPLAITMTGELADCYESKRDGVQRILSAVEAASDHQPVQVYLVDGRFVSSADAREQWALTAASNWHALASWVAQEVEPAQGVLIDLGSTSCDVIPFAAGRVVASGRSDLERMLAGELIYTGVVRSPVCSVIDRIQLRGKEIKPAQERFANTSDAYLWLGEMAEDIERRDSADGRPWTRDCAGQRLARMLCADRDELSVAEMNKLADAVKDSQLAVIDSAVRRALARSLNDAKQIAGGAAIQVWLAGEGEFLLRQLPCLQTADGQDAKPRFSLHSLATKYGQSISQVAPAYAIASLLARQTPTRPSRGSGR